MSSDPVAVLDKLFELTDRLGALMQTTLTERGLTTARAEVLLVLHEHGRPMVQRELSQALRCTPRHVTALVDVLETDHWVTRGPHPTDRRATLVALTERGAAAADRMNTERRDAAHALLGALPAADLTGFVAVADHVLAHLTAGPAPDPVRTSPSDVERPDPLDSRPPARSPSSGSGGGSC